MIIIANYSVLEAALQIPLSGGIEVFGKDMNRLSKCEISDDK